LREADVFVGIYRKEYGWIAPDMTVSGLEDEFAIGAERGIPRFMYVHSDAADRDPRLSALLARIKDVTYFIFAEPAELFERLRDDLGGELARRWRLAETKRVASLHSASRLLEAIAPADARLPRQGVIDVIKTQLREKRVIEVVGPLGSGKSVLLASLAQELRWPFVIGPESSAELIESVDRAIAPDELPAADTAAATARISTWSRDSGGAIVVDACRDVRTISEVVDAMGRQGGQARVVFSSTIPGAAAFERVEVPRLSEDEVQEYLRRRTGGDPSPEAIRAAVLRSAGLPLFLRLMVLGDGEPSNLEDLERARFARLPTEARELVQLLAIAARPIDLDVAQDLLGSKSTEKLLEILRSAEALVVCDGREVSFVHTHVRATMQAIAGADSTRARLQTRQLTDALFRRGETIRSVMMALAHQLTVPLARLRRAADDAAIVNDFPALAEIESARRSMVPTSGKGTREYVLASISMANALSETGRNLEATPIWEEARKAAGGALDAELADLVDEMKLVRSALAGASRSEVAAVVQRQETALLLGDKWRATRLTIDLSTLYLRIRDFDKAIKYSQQACELFKELGEPHGERVAKKNLAAALLSVRGREEEGRRTLEELTARENLTRREEAWWLNMRCRLLRRDGKNAEAGELSERAVAIGEELGDLGVVAINATNRGNAARALGDVAGAEKWFSRASGAAKEAGSVSGEALASILLAELLEQSAPAKAEAHASHAAALLRNSAAVDDLSRAYHVKGRILETMGRKREAAESWARAVFGGGLSEPTGLRLLGRVFDYLAEEKSMPEALDTLLKWSELNGEPVEMVEAANMLAVCLVKVAPGPAGAQLAALVYRRVVERMPVAIKRRFFRQSVRELLKEGHGGTNLWVVLGLLRCPFSDAVTLEDLRWVGDKIHEMDVGLSFRVHGDGAVIGTVAIQAKAGTLWITVNQIDDVVETALVSMVLWLLLHGSGPTLMEDVLQDVSAYRSAVDVKVVAFSEARQLGFPIREEDLSAGGAVTRPTTVGDDLPTIVVYRDGAMESSERGFLSLLGRTLNEIAIQFLGGETSEDTMLRVVSRALSPMFTLDRDEKEYEED
jgi:tetratricopeptide (TPR) repeat protein